MDSNCVSPTAVSCENSARCESLASKLANFTSQFFGAVTKTDLLPSGVSWTLGCGLETGLAENPRGYNEGITCYFLRLLYDNIQALRGPEGEAGKDGIDGANAVSAVLSDFSQPAVGGDVVVLVIPTRALAPELLVFVQTSGWYEILSNDTSTVTLRLVAAVDSPPVTVFSGNVIVPVSPSGIPTQGVVGNAGVQGMRGVEGPAGIKGTDSNPEIFGSYVGTGKTDFITTISNNTPVEVKFDNATVDIYLPNSGTFYIAGTTQTLTGTSAVLFLALVSFVVIVTATNVIVAVYNTLAEATAALQPGQSVVQKATEVLDTTWQATPYEPRLLQTFFSTVGPRTIRLYVNQDAAPTVMIRADSTSFNWFQVV